MKLNKLYQSILYCSFAIPTMGIAQSADKADDELLGTIDEVVVTGSFIKREKFDMASPIETLDSIEIQQSGYTNVGEYIRDLTYTTNVDTVSNVLGVSDGTQDSVSARFNLRGLGESSTLTLFDGRRVIDSGAVGSIMPDIAMDRAEVILDGGAATYGTDAVAGVVNLIPIKKFDGFKLRGFYTKDAEWTSHENKISGLFGTSSDKWNFVGAIEYAERPDAIYRSDRPEFLRADNDTSTTGNPGTFTGPISIIGFRTDPGCGTANDGNTDDGLVGSYPSGIPAIPVFGVNAVCTFEYGAYQDYKRPYKDMVASIVTSYEVSDDLTIEFLLNHDDRTSRLISSPSTGEQGSNNLMTIPGAHPNNPFGVAVRPRSWRPFSNNGATQPSSNDSHGSASPEFNTVTTSYALVSEFNLGSSSWSGEAAFTQARNSRYIDGYAINLDNLAQALRGNGGPNGNQWFNPFFSASTYSSSYVGCETGTGAGCSANDQALVDWLFEKYNFKDYQFDYWSTEGFVTGDLFELPAGSVQLAVGAQIRETQYANWGSELQTRASVEFPTAAADGGPANVDYNSAQVNGLDQKVSVESQVQSVFFETLVPILDNLELTVAARYEDFKDLEVSKAVPKVSVRYTPIESLSLRASYGQGFLAPTVLEVTADPSPDCNESFAGNDPALGGSLAGSLSCVDGNPALDPEESEIVNIGATWKATDDLELSLDYQTIDYQDRIVRLSQLDALNLDLANFLKTQNLTLADWQALTTPAKTALFLPWAAGPDSDPLILRSPGGAVLQSTSRPNNVAAVEIDVVDFRAKYGLDTDNFGFFSVNWSTTWYLKYDYENAFGDTADATGMQNGRTDIAPPIPEFKHQLRLNWLNDNHFVGLTINHQDEVEFDAAVGPLFAPGVGFTGDTNGLNTAVAPEKIDALTIVDFRYGYSFKEAFNGRLELALGSNNIFDEKGQPLPVVGGLETRLQDPTGRTYYMEATYTFE